MSSSIDYYRAYSARDKRFDGLFFIGSKTTRIYCRPICPAKIPKESNCLFFESAAKAEKAKFRPCLRCRPELAPGKSPIDRSQYIAESLIYFVEEQEGIEVENFESLARKFELSSRQLRRIVQNEFGVSLKELLLTRRLLLAKKLLTETSLLIIDIAFASGFASLRRFNDAFRIRYGMPPSRLRKKRTLEIAQEKITETVTLQLNYRKPFDWMHLLVFLRLQILKGVNAVIDDSAYCRTVEIKKARGWVRVCDCPEKSALKVTLSQSLIAVLPILLRRLRSLFDLSARPLMISAQLQRDPFLKKIICKNPGLRVPGAFDSFEVAYMAILRPNQTIQSSSKLADSIAHVYGEPIQTPESQLIRLTPTAERVSTLTVQELVNLSVSHSDAQKLIALAKTICRGELALIPGVDPEKTIEKLSSVLNVGSVTAQAIAMRALQWPDAFSEKSKELQEVLGHLSPTKVKQISSNWRPWRAYATLYLWQAERCKRKSEK